MKHSKFIDLFAGCGGLSLGLENAGFEVVFFNEIVPTFAATYLANHQLEAGNYYIGDINGLNANIETYRDIILNPEKPITLVCGGPPCQGFSMRTGSGLLMIQEINYIRHICNFCHIRVRSFS